MRQICLSPLPPEEIQTLEQMVRYHPQSRARLRAQVVLMSQRGWDQTKITQALEVSWNFVHRTLTHYQVQGFLGLTEHHPGRKPKLTAAQAHQVVLWVEDGPEAYRYTFSQWDTRSLQWRIEIVFNVRLSREAIRRQLRVQGLRWKRPKSCSLPPDPGQYAQTQTELKGLLAQAHAGKIVLLLHDEAIVTLTTTVQCGWSRQGIQLSIPSTGKRGKAHRCAVFAVVNPLTGETHYRLFEAVNKASMRRFLKHVARYYGSKDCPVWMVLDNHSAHLKLEGEFQAAGITPYYLKPRCSILNGIEHLWKWMRSRNFHNHFFQTVPELKKAVTRFFCYIAGIKAQVIQRVA